MLQSMFKTLRGLIFDSDFRRLLIGISIPIILQMLLTNGLSFVDTLMVGRLGEVEVAAVGLANQMFFLIFLVFFGISSGTSIFVAQFWGDKDNEGIHRVLGFSLVLALSCALPVALASAFIPRTLMRILSTDPQVIEVGAAYLRIVAPSYLFAGASFCFAMALRSVERPRIPLVATALSLSVNTGLNAILIFGLFSFPAMGVRGAALATLIGRGLELAVLLGLVYKRRLPVAAPLHELFAFTRPLVTKVMKIATPVIFNELVWSLGMVMYKIVFSRMGTGVIAASNVTESVQGLFFIVLIGTGNASAIMIGKKIGEKDKETAGRFAAYFMALALLEGLVLGLLMFLSAPLLVLPFNMEKDIIDLTRHTLFALSFLIPIKSLNLHLIVGVLRSGGDTTFSFTAELIGVWAVGVPLAFFSGLFLKLPLPTVYLIVGLEELFKLVILGLRFRSGKWINDLTRKKESAAL